MWKMMYWMNLKVYAFRPLESFHTRRHTPGAALRALVLMRTALGRSRISTRGPEDTKRPHGGEPWGLSYALSFTMGAAQSAQIRLTSFVARTD